MKTKLIATVAACVLGLFSDARSRDNLERQLRNPGTAILLGLLSTLPAASGVLSGWTIGGDSVDLIQTLLARCRAAITRSIPEWLKQRGLDLSDDHGPGDRCILHKISFWLAGNPDNSAAKSLLAGTDEEVSRRSISFRAGHSKGSMGWEQENSFTFQAIRQLRRT